MRLKKSDYYINIPPDLIAQNPSEKRDASRLMVVDRRSGRIEHRKFYEITDYFKKGDLLVVNESKVIPARLIGKRMDTGSNAEFLLLEQTAPDEWKSIMKPGKKGREGTEFTFGSGIMTAVIKKSWDDGNKTVKFNYCGNFYEILSQIGQMPLPPYITHCDADTKERYQTVYAKNEGSSAAPTAGLHFTDEILTDLRLRGVEIVPITLHVGLGTFRPVKEEFITDHKMHEEYYYIPVESAEKINIAKRDGRRITAVGTTSCRTLEACFQKYGEIKPGGDRTNIFIYEGFKFSVIDSLITNFHLPESTLLMLVSAFYDRKKIIQAYELAVEEKYRFFSFGDSMLII